VVSQPSTDAVAIGNLDGVHLGHQALVHSALRSAHSRGGKACVLTFSPHPQEVLHPQTTGHRLTTDLEKKQLLLALGVDRVEFLRFDAALAALSPQAFFEAYLAQGLGAYSLHVGADFRFGARRQGDTQLLQSLAEASGRQVQILPAVEQGGERISSTRIRGCLEKGDVRQAAQLLGRPYVVAGPVEAGAGRGKTLGIPTANVAYPTVKAIPADGVYAGRVMVGGVSHLAVANLGRRPTFEADRPEVAVLEAHLLDFGGSLYGQIVEFEFMERVREERRFSGVAELKAQIALDIARVRSLS